MRHRAPLSRTRISHRTHWTTVRQTATPAPYKLSTNVRILPQPLRGLILAQIYDNRSFFDPLTIYLVINNRHQTHKTETTWD